MRKIPVQYAKRIVGRRVYGGQSTYIPLRVNTARVISLFCSERFNVSGNYNCSSREAIGPFWTTLQKWLSPGAALYTILYSHLLFSFAYFYTAIVLNPTEMAENMVKYGGHIPRKPGKRPLNILTMFLFG